MTELNAAQYETLCQRAAAASAAIYGRAQPLIERSRDLDLLGLCYATMRIGADQPITLIDIAPSDQGSGYSYLTGFRLADGTNLDSEGDEIDSGVLVEHFPDSYDSYDVEQFAHALEYEWLVGEVGVHSDGTYGVEVDVQAVLKNLAHLTAFLDPMPDPADLPAIEAWLDGVEADLTPKESAP